MALTGAHVVCGYVTDLKGAKLFTPIWSETIALGSSTTQSSPLAGGSLTAENVASVVFRVRAGSAEMYAAAGLQPDAAQAVGNTPDKTRQHLVASEEKDIPATLPGSKINVAAA